jgi:sterol desaturase/sphingolipid hydroxylase (fatty acid hydroxylase superfamily)
VRVLWRCHELHHSQEDMNALTVFRTHPFLHVSYLLALVPGVVLLANGAVSSSVLIAYGVFVAFAHSNTNLDFGPLRRIIVSPNYHRIHHRRDGAQDVNLGFAFSVWDQLARRAVFPDETTIGIDTGLPGRPLTVEHSGPRARYLHALGAQLVGPFRPMSVPVDLPSHREERSGAPGA